MNHAEPVTRVCRHGHTRSKPAAAWLIGMIALCAGCDTHQFSATFLGA